MQQLVIQFKSRNKGILYCGESWLRKNLSDEVFIFQDRIVLKFDRRNNTDLQTCMFSPKSLFRYEIQKSLCFYLSVTGMIPEVREICLITGENTEFLEDLSFAEKWHKCKIERVIACNTAAKVFGSGKAAQTAYIALTYYLKAQLDHFSHDRFRAAWSGLNALYTFLAPENADKEWKKINALQTYLVADSLLPVQSFVSSLDDQFWNSLDWYSYTKNLCTNENGKLKAFDKVIQEVFELKDPMLLSQITNYMRSAVYKDESKGQKQQTDYQRCRKTIEKEINSCSISYLSRTKFLILKYCYMLRNRSFHAEKAYPLFMINKSSTKSQEDILTELLLMTMEGLLKEM